MATYRTIPIQQNPQPPTPAASEFNTRPTLLSSANTDGLLETVCPISQSIPHRLPITTGPRDPANNPLFCGVNQKSCITSLPPLQSMSNQMGSHMRTYLVSLLYALPFIFRTEFPRSSNEQDGVLQPLDHQEMEEASKRWKSFSSQSRVPAPLNFMYPRYDRGAVFAALNQLSLTTPFTSMAVTLISATYPSRYGWNLPDMLITSPTIPTCRIPASESHSLTESYQFSQFKDGIAVKGPDSLQVYHDKSHIPAHTQGFQYDLITYPYGWSDGIESFCKIGQYHPHCADPHSRAHVERDFLAYTMGEPSLFKVLDEYLNIIYSNAISKSFQWLWGSPTPVIDSPRHRAALSNLYSQVNHQQGQVLHSKNGL